MKNKGKAILTALLSIAVILSLGTGCSTVSVSTNQYLGIPAYPPTNPASVEILRTEPLRPHERLGEITLEPQGDPPVTKIEEKMREAAAKMGANAAVLVVDRTMRMGAVVTGGWYGRQISPNFQRVIIAVAIKYTDQRY